MLKRINEQKLPVITLLLIVVLQLISHVSHSPVWLTVFVLIICIFRFLAEKTFRHNTPFLTRFFLISFSTTVFFLYYRLDFTVEMATSFLLMASSLKLIEIKTKKDTLIFVYAMLYLSAVSFLFDQALLHTLLQICMIASCLYALLRINTGYVSAGYTDFFRQQWPSLFKSLMLAVPLVLICFLFFPRISPLWSIPIKTDSAKTGFSDRMSPGDIASLVKSSERAFRATFSGPVPKKSELYWRGLVLDEFDGRVWKQASKSVPNLGKYKIDPGTFYDTDKPFYQVMLEPHKQKWVFALEGAQASSSNVMLSDMGVFSLKTEAIQATHYKMEQTKTNVPDVKFPLIPSLVVLNDKARRKSSYYQDLQLPQGSQNSQTQAYVSELNNRISDPYALLNFLMEQFSDDEFYYTLRPPVLGANSVDEFLFNSKQGFCAHYAGSLAYMLRLSGIPARVIVGYQGGEFNQKSEYLIVHQFDAHAWVEAKLPSLGWVRIDPTSMVSPERIMNGFEETMAGSSGFLEGSPFSSMMLRSGMFSWLRLRMDELNFNWQKWVVNYNKDEQYGLVKNIFGEFSLLKIALFFVYCFIVIFFGMIAYIWLRQFKGKYTFAEKKYIIWTLILAKLGFRRRLGETPRAFLKRVRNRMNGFIVSVTESKTQALERDEYGSGK